MKRFTKAALGLVALSSMLGIQVDAQNLNNAACGRINNNTNGVIRFRSNTGQFTNAAPVAQVSNAGTIDMTGTDNLFTGTNPLGSSASNRIPGRVLWSATTPTQNVQNRWYVNLNVSGNTKNMRDSIFVGGIYTIANGTGNRTYNGTFFYDGTGAQTVVTEKGINSYNNLELQNSVAASSKTVSGDTATVNGTFLNNANNLGGLTVSGAGVLNLRGTSNSNSPLIVSGANSAINLTNPAANLTLGNNSTFLADNGGRVNVSSTFAPAALVIQTGSTYRLGNTGTGGQFHLTGAGMNVFGTYLNQLPALTNAFYDCASTVRYLATANGQVVQATSSVEPNRYGKLETSGGNKTANGDVHVKCGLFVNPNNGPLQQIAMGTNTMFVYNPNPGTLTPVQYDNGLTDCASGSEVLGNMRIEVPSNVGTTNAMTFNNRFTTLRFTNTANTPSTITINSQPATNPNNYIA
ncbi:MAG: hypothetical protein JNL32_04985, partial [Candidatus Kapabacteria bacterium]|nr:hypothetical protein [Candidatus Kapabacteria bacterium]